MDLKVISRRIKRARVKNYRLLFVILGPEGPKRIPDFCNLLSKGKAKDFSVLFCSDSLGDTSVKEDQENVYCENKNASSKVIYVRYSEIESAMYKSFGMIVLHDIDNIKPSSLASIIESVQGGGAIILIFDKIKDINEFTSSESCMNKKSRYFCRLCTSIKHLCESNHSCMILDDELNVLIQAKHTSDLSKDLDKSENSEKLEKLKSESASDIVSSALVNLCQTTDQATVLLKFLDALKKRTFQSVISVSSLKGRGKSAALGLAIAGSLALDYSNIFISSSSYENIIIVFKFLFKGLDALNYKEDEDYDVIQSVNHKYKNALLGINVFKDHCQTVRFILPGDIEKKLEQAELVVIDEAATIPLPLLKRLWGSHIVLMASTINGCGGSGKFLYESIVRDIHQPISLRSDQPLTVSPAIDEKLEVLNEPIYYSSGDDVENWINRLLCLECSINKSLSYGCRDPQECQLYYICKEILFSCESPAEEFLQQLMSFFLCSKRIMSPDFFRQMADDPDYHIFCLLSPLCISTKASPEILCAILVHAENRVPSCVVYSGKNQKENLSGCFNEWRTVEKNGEEFVPKHGIHILDIVTHPEYRRMGYGRRALNLLQEFYEGKSISLDDAPFICLSRNKKNIGEQKTKLLLQLTEVEPEKIDYLSVSCFLTSPLLRFWKKGEFVPVFISREKNFAQEHLCLMMKSLNDEFCPYMQENWRYFQEYYFEHLKTDLKSLPSSFALNLLKSNISNNLPGKELTKEDIDIYINPQHMKELEKYCQNLSDLHFIMSSLPVLAKLYFTNSFGDVALSTLQEAILLAVGLQINTIDNISRDLQLPSVQVHGLLNRTIRKLTSYLNSVIEKTLEKSIKIPERIMDPISQDLDEELKEAAEKIRIQQMEECKKLKDMDFSQFAIKGSEEDWEKALHGGRKTLVSIKSFKKAPEDVEFPDPSKQSGKRKKHMKNKR